MDTFRKTERVLTDKQVNFMNEVKTKAEELYALLDKANTPNIGREIALAKTHLETAIMWAVKGITG